MATINNINTSSLLELFEKVFFKNGYEISTRWDDFDNHFKGLYKGNLTFITGNPSIGKSNFLLYLIYYITRNDDNILFFSLQSNRYKLINTLREMLNVTVLDLIKLRNNELTEDEEALWNEKLRIFERIFITHSCNYETLYDSVKTFLQTNKDTKVIFIDAMDNISNPEYITYTTACRLLKQIAIDFDIPVVVTTANTPENMEKIFIFADVIIEIYKENDKDIYPYVKTIKNNNAPTNDDKFLFNFPLF